MSKIDLDDLVASFAANHIGQDNIDLAKVRAQLAQMLFLQTQRPQGQPQGAPTTTPTTRTAMPNWPSPIDAPRRRSRAASIVMKDSDIAEEDEMDEILEVDELLGPIAHLHYLNPPNSPQRTGPSMPYHFPDYTPSQPIHVPHHPHHAHTSSFDSQSSSPFSDPFYAAQVHAMNNPPSFFSPSSFSAAGQAPASPFYQQQPQKTSQARPPLTIDTRTRCVPPRAQGGPASEANYRSHMY